MFQAEVTMLGAMKLLVECPQQQQAPKFNQPMKEISPGLL
jgi:hypothetical protein